MGVNKIIKGRQDRFRGKDRFKGMVRYHQGCTKFNEDKREGGVHTSLRLGCVIKGMAKS